MIAHRCISPCVLSLCVDNQQVHHREEDNGPFWTGEENSHGALRVDNHICWTVWDTKEKDRAKRTPRQAPETVPVQYTGGTQ